MRVSEKMPWEGQQYPYGIGELWSVAWYVPHYFLDLRWPSHPPQRMHILTYWCHGSNLNCPTWVNDECRCMVEF